MKKRKMSDAERHSAGAIVTHQGRFNSLIPHSNETELTQPFIDQWVIPFYMNLNKTDQDWINKIVGLYEEISDEIILKNLGDFNWRTRSTGSFFASIKNKHEFTDIIGTHLLKSEVCFSGSEYAVTLSFFNTNESVKYLNEYLDYYLLHPELYFDQSSVISAIKYLDSINGSNFLSNHLDNWESMLINQKKLKIRNNEAFLTSPDIPEDVKKGLMEMKFDDVDFSIHTHGIEKRIKTIEIIQSHALR